ncbi:uncharacterized protein EV422DRAFT_564913 [Fimicolochytrium jonesii]|uniref:uncharacterized protein n=1 Tax=Fimicolochytrium jonesii TaxID=1396493 RepID=UPI0022FE93D7|nr:uncharacterized protein EV422DRAFT_564913 [Fimicolochytrium jonesii]KAI8824207.1 hypothetical protein EV422DRAFT_564913 [Fimicolochytrium jonesii]
MASNANNTSAQPSLVHGHVQYVKGAVEETVGSMLNAPAWTESGKNDKALGEAEMRAADQSTQATRDASNASRENKSLLEKEGQAEGLAGRAAFCPGMQKHGEEKVAASHQNTL